MMMMHLTSHRAGEPALLVRFGFFAQNVAGIGLVVSNFSSQNPRAPTDKANACDA